MTRCRIAMAALAAIWCSLAHAAPSIEKMTITPASGAKVGEKIVVQVDFSEAVADGLCGMEIEFGDGRRETFKIKPETKLPIVIEHTYKTAGAGYKVRAAGNRVENALSCNGKQIIMYAVAPAPVSAAVPTLAPSAACPNAWVLKGKPAKDGGFTCVPAKGVANPQKPAQAIACPAGTAYFAKGKTLGCEKE